MVSPLGTFTYSDFRRDLLEERFDDPVQFDKDLQQYRDSYNSPLGTMDSASYGYKKYEAPAPDPHAFVNQYHRDTLKDEKGLRNDDESVTTVMARGLEVDGQIYQVPGYDREEGRILDLGEDGEIQGDTEIRRKWEPLVRQGKIPPVAAAEYDTKFWYDKYLNDPAYEGINEEQLDQIIIQNHHPANIEARKNHAKNISTGKKTFLGVGYDPGPYNAYSKRNEATIEAIANGLEPILRAEHTWNKFKDEVEHLYTKVASFSLLPTPAQRSVQNVDFFGSGNASRIGDIKDTDVYKELPIVEGGLSSPGKMLIRELKSRLVKDVKSAFGMEVKPDVITDINEIFEPDEIEKLTEIIEQESKIHGGISPEGTVIGDLYSPEKSKAYSEAVEDFAAGGLGEIKGDVYTKAQLSWNPEENKKLLPKNKMMGFINEVILGDAAQTPQQQLRYTLGNFTVKDMGDHWELFDIYDFSRFADDQDKGLSKNLEGRGAMSVIKDLWTEYNRTKGDRERGQRYDALRDAMAVVLSDKYGNATQIRVKIPKRKKPPNIGAMPAK